jgi:hypothetical protein
MPFQEKERQEWIIQKIETDSKEIRVFLITEWLPVALPLPGVQKRANGTTNGNHDVLECPVGRYKAPTGSIVGGFPPRPLSVSTYPWPRGKTTIFAMMTKMSSGWEMPIA